MSMEPVYGYPCVQDPHDFDPDRECSSPQEIETWRTACATYGKTGYQPNKGCYSEHSDDGQLVKHVTRTSWGIGVNLIRKCDGWNCDMRFCEFVTCHECGGDFCEECWPKHDAREDCDS